MFFKLELFRAERFVISANKCKICIKRVYLFLLKMTFTRGLLKYNTKRAQIF